MEPFEVPIARKHLLSTSASLTLCSLPKFPSPPDAVEKDSADGDGAAAEGEDNKEPKRKGLSMVEKVI